MGKLFFILAFLVPFAGKTQGQSLTVDDLLTLSTIPSKSFDNYIAKKGFPIKRRSLVENCMGFTFFEESKVSDSSSVVRSLDWYKKNDTWCIVLHTSSQQEYVTGRNSLKKMNFFTGSKDTSLASSLLFQKKTITAETMAAKNEDKGMYTITVKNKEMPEQGKVQYADDLLRFDSHEYLTSFFGDNNVKKDVFYLSETETRNCSILFPNTNRQVVFVWEEENNFRKILFMQITGSISATSTAKFSGGISQNAWSLRNGIYSGMMLEDLVELNASDFEFYGHNSEYSMMVEPKNTGKINFKRIGIRLTCFNCSGAGLMNRSEVSATNAIENDLALHVSSIMISP